ncbi:MAG TPA: ABC transporter substrate-binding protein [Pyrinomonadaceae bacterium]|jgi:peptide/nickel transport system substrate-binding protein|nr:ABC transporter substrate-binding protein [Pyrinomonadaceae bacterium]
MKILPLQRWLLASVVVALATASGACVQQTEQQPQPGGASASKSEPARERVPGTRGGSLSYRTSVPPKTLNALMFTDEPSFTVSFFLLGARLVDFDHDAQRFIPALAEVWQLAPDGKTLELTLRDGLKFSDGHPLTSEDVVFTFRAIYDERVGSILRTTLTIGGRQIEVTPLDARRLRLVFPEPVAVPETYLVNVAILPRHVLEESLQKGKFGSEAYSITSDPRTVVTAGAFTVESVTPGERIALQRNPNYWKRDAAGTQLPYLDKLVVEVVGDANAAVARLGEGGLDIVDRIRPSDYAGLHNQQGAVRAYDLGPGLSTDHLWFNLNEGGQNGKPYVAPEKYAWFADVRFRRAVAHAIDRQSIASATLQGLATPLHGFVTTGNRAWFMDDLPRTGYDLTRARALLSEAGFVVRGTPDAPELFDAKGNRVEFTLLVQSSNEERKAEAAVVQEDLARLGIRMQVAPLETGEVMRRITGSLDYEAALFGTIVSDTDPSSYSNFLKSTSEGHQWRPKQAKPATDWEARIDGLVADLSREPNMERRRAIFRDIQLVFLEHQPVVPIVARHIVVAAHTRVGNYRPSVVVPYSMWNADELFVKK